MGEWVADSGEAAFEELGEPFVLGLCGVIPEEIKGENRTFNRRNQVNECRPIAFDFR